MSDLKINSYPMHIGDWHSGTSRMNLAEAGAYLCLVHKYIEDGTLNRSLSEAYALCGAQSRNDRRAVRRVIQLKFIDDGQRLISPYADAILGKMKAQPWLWRDRAWSRPYMPDAVRLVIFERDGHQCQYCDTMAGPFEVDHVHPVSRGGTDDLENLICACVSCNRSKGAKLLSEWRCEA